MQVLLAWLSDRCLLAWSKAVTGSRRLIHIMSGYFSIRSRLSLLALVCAGVAPTFAQGPQATPSIWAPASTPAHEIYGLSLFVLLITGAIFAVVGGLLVFVIVKFRARELGRRARAGADLRQRAGGTGLDRDSGADCRGSLSHHGAHHLCHSGRARAQIRARRHRHRAPVLVGVSLSQAGHRDCE